MQRLRRPRERGQATIEFALVSVLFLMLVFAIFNFGIAFMNYSQITDAAREGARNAVVNRMNGQATMISAGTSAAKSAASGLTTGLAVAVTSGTGSWGQGDPITVTVSYPYTIDIMGLVVGSGTLKAQTTMRAE